jgi:hypothetical protein
MLEAHASKGVSGRRTAIVFAGLAVLSAFASAYLAGAMLSAAGFDTLPLPGLYFGLALGLGAWLCCGRGVTGALTFLATTIVAWLLAFEAARRVSQLLGQAGLREVGGLDVENLVAGIIAGAVGAGGTFIGARIVAPGLWSASRLGRVTLAGAALGALLDPAIEGDGAMLLLLFLPWQTAVAALIGGYMARPAVAG